MKTLICTLLGVCLAGSVARAQTSAFTYQGRLTENGVATNRLYDMVFSLHSTPFGLSDSVGTPITNAPVAVTNGLFAATLDFGAGVYNGSYLWLQVGVRTNGSTAAYSMLTPLQFIASTPYAVQALNAGTAVTALNLSGTVAATNLSGTIPVAQLPTNVVLTTGSAMFAGSVTATNFVGNGAGLTNVAAAGLVGTIADAQLSPNVALLNASASFNGTVSATNFSGMGTGLTNVPGRIYATVPTGVAIQAQPNTGYLATNDTTAVVVTLPASPLVGDTVRISGGGAGGWVVAQNSGQSILTANLPGTLGLGWALRETARNWKAIASSTDGRKLVATVSPSSTRIYVSTNYGTSWASNATALPNLNWQAVASSGNGTTLAAVPGSSGQVYNSLDSGATWNPHGPTIAWGGIASSLDGTHMAAVAASGGIYLSTDSGNTWSSPIPTNRTWTGVASSADGTRLVACPGGGNIYTSTNSGVNWTPHDSSRSWSSVASSYDGSVLVACDNGGLSGGFVYVSVDYGFTWSATASLQVWTAVSCSADGSKMVAVFNASGTGGIYISNDTGRTWTPSTFSTTLGYDGAVFSGDGSTLAVLAPASPILVYSQVSTTSGQTGSLTGTRQSAVELEYIGNGVFMPISSIGAVRSH